jgi:hypothetical protein
MMQTFVKTSVTKVVEYLPLCDKFSGASLQVRKLQAERDWLQEQIEPGSVERPIVIEEPMQLPARPPVRHLSL